MTNVDGKECWDMSYEKYCTATVTNVEYIQKNCGLRLPLNCVTPLSCSYSTEMNVTGEIKEYGVQW